MNPNELELLGSIDTKLTLILACAVAVVVIGFVRAFFTVTFTRKRTAEERVLERYHELFREQQYEKLLRLVGERIEKNPTDIQMIWLKGKTLFQTGRDEEARAAFESLQRMEPDWEESAQRYLDRIRERSADAGT